MNQVNSLTVTSHFFDLGDNYSFESLTCMHTPLIFKCHPPKFLFCAFWSQYHPEILFFVVDQFRGLPLDDYGENHEKSCFSDLVHIGTLQCKHSANIWFVWIYFMFSDSSGKNKTKISKKPYIIGQNPCLLI